MNGLLCRHLALLALGLFARPAHAIALYQIDNFQLDPPTTLGWTGGSSPYNLPDPDDPSIRYLDLTTGPGPSNLGAYNEAQWIGDYAAAGVTHVSIDFKNFGPDPVSLRVMIATVGCPTTCTAWTSTIPTVLAPLDPPQWVKVDFSLAEPDLTLVAGSLSYASSIASVSRFHLRHDDGTPSPPGTPSPVHARLGVDNITALPEPSCSTGVAAGCFVLLSNDRLRRRRARRESSLE